MIRREQSQAGDTMVGQQVGGQMEGIQGPEAPTRRNERP